MGFGCMVPAKKTATFSLKVTRLHREAIKQVAVILEPTTNQMLHTFRTLDLGYYAEELRTQQHRALAFGKVCPDQ